jgi:DNA polymerase III delta prime subunit
MSEASSDADAESTSSPGREIWIEKYRPQTLQDIYGQEDTIERLQSYVDRDDLPHLMFAGPAGVGKCVTGETPVLTNRGIERIDSLVGDVDGFAPPEDGLEILSLDRDSELSYTAPSDVFARTASNLVRLETRDGSTMTVTPEHKLLVISPDGLVWKQAGDIEPGDRISRPLAAPTPADGPDRLDWLSEMNGERTVVHVDSDFATEHGLDGTELPLSRLRDMRIDDDDLRAGVSRIQYVNTVGHRSRPLTPPWELTPQLSRFVGLAVSEASLDGGRIKFYNTDSSLRQAFDDAVSSLFDLPTEHGTQQGVPYVEVRSRTLTHYLESVFDVFRSAADSSASAIGSSIVTAADESRAAFLRAMFDAEAHVTDHGVVELTQKNGDHVTLLSYLLATFGIPSRRKTESKAATNGSGIERQYHTLYLSGADSLRRFEEEIGFNIPHKRDRLATNGSKPSNPNHDTIPAQRTARQLCADLNLPAGELLSPSLDPETPGRQAHLADLRAVLDSATGRIEAAQETLVRLDTLAAELEAASGVPATWVGGRSQFEPLDVRRTVAQQTGIRSDRLLEYADGRRTPLASRATSLLSDRGALSDRPSIDRLQRELRTCLDALGVSQNEVAAGTDLRGTDVGNLLSVEDHAVGSLTRFATVADRLRTLANRMLSLDTVERLDALDRVVTADLYYDEVTAVDDVEEPQRVFDLTVPHSRNYVAGFVPTVMHNTTAATAIARALYGDDWRGNFLELNASDERGIDVVRDRIKNFARSSFGGYDYHLIFLDEADSLTSDAQSALRRTMEQFSDNTRFILSCNYSSKIIDPIQSRCAVFRFSPLADDAVRQQVEDIAAAEGIETTSDGVDALVYAADGDMRRAINALQAAATTGEVVDEEAVFTVTSTARPEDIREMVEAAIAGDFPAARAKLSTLLDDVGMAGGDIIDQLHRSVWEFDLSDREAARLMDRIGEVDYRIAEGANEQVQLEALLASLALDD